MAGGDGFGPPAAIIRKTFRRAHIVNNVAGRVWPRAENFDGLRARIGALALDLGRFGFVNPASHFGFQFGVRARNRPRRVRQRPHRIVGLAYVLAVGSAATFGPRVNAVVPLDGTTRLHADRRAYPCGA